MILEKHTQFLKLCMHFHIIDLVRQNDMRKIYTFRYIDNYKCAMTSLQPIPFSV